MKSNQVIWPEPIVEKLRSFRSEHFTGRNVRFYSTTILESEDLLLNPILGRAYLLKILGAL
ncbi:hypothetical protein [Paenibacillus sp. Soil787]|uniref:hypothetical protein n=1 Tax=Paenibacillus sp. Soil787 TaxID=1736411 RepID=UPI0006FE758F|nr:hypothetical protein [Paenibacillus sp. Soil787]KRF39838.1 hypothetical protein ASG93_23030 [Paenibacillus sp. Soil787]